MSKAMEALVSEIVDRVTRDVLARIDARSERRERPEKIGVLTTEQAAAYCGLASAQSLYNLISQGRGPVYFKHGRLNAFYESDLDIWNLERLAPPGVQTHR